MTLTMRRNYGLVLPKNYVSIEKDEMEYIDGGWGVPNWVVGGTINLAISAACGGIGATLTVYSKRCLSSASKMIFAKDIKRKLIAKGISSGIAASVAGWIPSLLTFLGAICDPGGWIASKFDSKDCKPNNGWINW